MTPFMCLVNIDVILNENSFSSPQPRPHFHFIKRLHSEDTDELNTAVHRYIKTKPDKLTNPAWGVLIKGSNYYIHYSAELLPATTHCMSASE